MKPEFSILPWEYRGSGADTTPHAATELEIGGKKRQFLLKMRDGVIYFKEPKLASVFAVPRLFESEMRGDELVRAWRCEVEGGNYGRFVCRPLESLRSLASTVVTLIHRSDYSGLISDAFAPDWKETPSHRDSKQLDLWKPRIKLPTWRAIQRQRDSWLDRLMPESERQNIETHWVAGSEEELKRVFALVMRLHARATPTNRVSEWMFGTTNPTSGGSWWGTSFNPNYHPDLRFSSALVPVMRLLEEHFVVLGMKWYNEVYRPFKHRGNNDFTRTGNARWGDEWRGNFYARADNIKLEVDIPAHLSHHEKLELLLELRDWLDGKVSPRQSANWLSKALD